MRCKGRQLDYFLKDWKFLAFGNIAGSLAMTGDDDLRIRPGRIRGGVAGNFKPFAARVLASAESGAVYCRRASHQPVLDWSRSRRGVQRGPRAHPPIAKASGIVEEAKGGRHGLAGRPPSLVACARWVTTSHGRRCAECPALSAARATSAFYDLAQIRQQTFGRLQICSVSSLRELIEDRLQQCSAVLPLAAIPQQPGLSVPKSSSAGILMVNAAQNGLRSNSANTFDGTIERGILA
jgi:hypothetical protein